MEDPRSHQGATEANASLLRGTFKLGTGDAMFLIVRHFQGIELDTEYKLSVYGMEHGTEHAYVIKLHVFYSGLVQPYFLGKLSRHNFRNINYPSLI